VNEYKFGPTALAEHSSLFMIQQHARELILLSLNRERLTTQKLLCLPLLLWVPPYNTVHHNLQYQCSVKSLFIYFTTANI